MEEISDALADQQAELADLLDDLTETEWRLPTPCEGWDIADVVLHLAQTNDMAIGALEGRFGAVLTALTSGLPASTSIDEAAAAMVTRERALSIAEIFRRWSDGALELDRLLMIADPSERLEWVAGRLSARTLATTRLAETWIHTGDIAAALGRERQPDERLFPIARLAWRTIPYAFALSGRPLAGPVAFELIGPDGETWTFTDDTPPTTVIRGDALDLCLVAARRRDPARTGLSGEGPDVDAVLEVVRTYA